MAGGKRRFLFSTILAVVFLYLTFFPRPLGKELLIVPAWTLSVAKAKIFPENAKALRPSKNEDRERQAYGFRFPDVFGFVSPKGDLLFREAVDYDVALGQDFFINHSSVPRTFVVRDPQGRFLGNIAGNGYPFIRRNRLFLLSANHYGLSEWSAAGDLLWERKFGSLITAVEASKDSVLVGFVNGTIVLLGEKGKDGFITSPAGSKYSAVYQVGITENGGHLGIISGLEPQKLTIYEKLQNNYRVVVSKDLKSSYRRAVKGSFIDASSFFTFEQPGAAEIADPHSKRRCAVPVPGTMRSLSEEPLRGISSVLTETEFAFWAVGYLPNGKIVYRISLAKDKSFYFHQSKEFLLFGAGGRLFRVDLKVG